jgi:iron complex outermembrane recepter protein
MQTEASPTERLRLVAGLRLDVMGFGYDTRLDAVQTGRHRRPAATSVDYAHLSPKAGATYEAADELNLFVNYGHGFRAPSEGQLFRQGQAVNTVGLEPVKVDSYEAGARGLVGGRLNYDVSAYHMTKRDDILSFVNPDGSTENVNAGETLHRGVELGLGADLVHGLRADVAYSRAKHTYEEWRPRPDTDLGGNELETAPRTLASLSLSYSPGFHVGSRVGVEWTRVGSYWMDAQNTHRYPGHTLLNVRVAVPVAGGMSLFGRVMNVMDRGFAENAAYTEARGAEYAPGMPRTIYIGLRRN